METSLFLEAIAKPLLIVHAVSAFALTAFSYHMTTYIRKCVMEPSRFAWNRIRRLSTVYAWLGAASFLTGLCIYPVYRIRVRAEVFDVSMPHYTLLFDWKENLAAFIFLVPIFMWLNLRPKEPTPHTNKLYALSWVNTVVSTLLTLVGLWLVAVKSV